jgi:hypothetical protein
LNAKPELQLQLLNKNIGQKYSFWVLFLGRNFGKNLRFSLSEHCE